jgi:hypothetical protein
MKRLWICISALLIAASVFSVGGLRQASAKERTAKSTGDVGSSKLHEQGSPGHATKVMREAKKGKGSTERIREKINKRPDQYQQILNSTTILN